MLCKVVRGETNIIQCTYESNDLSIVITQMAAVFVGVM